jgi:hypothetical protein
MAPTRLCTKNRAPATQSISITEATLPVRVKGKVKVLPTESITIVETSLTRLANKIRSRPETVTISENRARLSTKIRALATQTITIGVGTTAIQKGKLRTLATQTVTIVETSLIRLTTKTRTLTLQTVAISENLARLSTKMRLLALQTVTLSDLAAAVKTTGAQNIVRAVPTQTVAIAESLSRLATKIRALTTQIVTISEAKNASRGKFRVIPAQFVTLSDAVTRLKTTGGGAAIVRSLSDSVTLAEISLARLATKTRTLSIQITSISENLTRLRAKIRAIPAQTVTIGTGTTAITLRQKIRTIAQNVTLSQVLDAFKNGIKLVAPQAPDKGGSGKMALYPKGPRLKQIKYPVYIVSERRRLERRRRLREREFVLIPAFKYNINKTVAPFVVTNPLQNTVRVHYALQRPQPVHFAGNSLPVQIPASQKRTQVHTAKSTFVMNQKAITRYGRKLNKIQKVMTLFLLATGADEAGL